MRIVAHTVSNDLTRAVTAHCGTVHPMSTTEITDPDRTELFEYDVGDVVVVDSDDRDDLHGALFEVRTQECDPQRRDTSKPDLRRRRYGLRAIPTGDEPRHPVAEDRLVPATAYDDPDFWVQSDEHDRYTDTVLDETCPVCGHDGVRLSGDSAAGVHTKTCMTCECRIDDDPEAPTHDRDRRKQMREADERVAMVPHGYQNTTALYARGHGTDLYWWYNDGSIHQHSADLLTGVVEEVALQGDVSVSEAARILERAIDASGADDPLTQVPATLLVDILSGVTDRGL